MHFSLAWLGKPVAWTRRKVRKHYVDKDALVRDGAAVITPAIDSAVAFSPVSVTVGGQEEIRARMAPVWEGWRVARKDLLTYLNRHPSDEIRHQGHEAVDAVTASSSATHYLFEMTWEKVPGINIHEVYVQADERNTQAVQAVRDLMDAVRAY
jgi:hypothetical protein